MKISCKVLINEKHEIASALTKAASGKVPSPVIKGLLKTVVIFFNSKLKDFGLDDTVLIKKLHVKNDDNSNLTLDIDTDITSYSKIIQLVEDLLTEKASEQVNMLVLPALDIIGQNLSTETINTLLVGYFANANSNTCVCNLINSLLEHKEIKVTLLELMVENS